MFLLLLLSEHYAKSWGCRNKQDNLSLCSQEVDILVRGCHDDIFGLHKETRKPVVSTALLFENMELSYFLYAPDLSQKFWVENILFFISFKRGLENTCMCLESVTTFASDKMNGDQNKTINNKVKTYIKPKNIYFLETLHTFLYVKLHICEFRAYRKLLDSKFINKMKLFLSS